MQSALYVSLSSQIAQQKKVESIAQNVANANTTGFRGEELQFSEVVAKTHSIDTPFAKAERAIVSRRPGSVAHTGNETDFAIAGDGWFAVRTPDGRAFTRDGRFSISGEGVLTNLSGRPVLDAGGGVITLNPGGPPPEVSRDGMITQAGAQIGVLGIFKLPEEAKLARYDDVSLISDMTAIPVVDFTQDGITQGAIEGSNVNSVQEISSLISAQRLFESISASIGSAEDVIVESIRMLGPASR